jgi:hypothetical protein
VKRMTKRKAGCQQIVRMTAMRGTVRAPPRTRRQHRRSRARRSKKDFGTGRFAVDQRRNVDQDPALARRRIV